MISFGYHNLLVTKNVRMTHHATLDFQFRCNPKSSFTVLLFYTAASRWYPHTSSTDQVYLLIFETLIQNLQSAIVSIIHYLGRHYCNRFTSLSHYCWRLNKTCRISTTQHNMVSHSAPNVSRFPQVLVFLLAVISNQSAKALKADGGMTMLELELAEQGSFPYVSLPESGKEILFEKFLQTYSREVIYSLLR